MSRMIDDPGRVDNTSSTISSCSLSRLPRTIPRNLQTGGVELPYRNKLSAVSVELLPLSHDPSDYPNRASISFKTLPDNSWPTMVMVPRPLAARSFTNADNIRRQKCRNFPTGCIVYCRGSGRTWPPFEENFIPRTKSSKFRFVSGLHDAGVTHSTLRAGSCLPSCTVLLSC